jgi:hypothetical protein
VCEGHPELPHDHAPDCGPGIPCGAPGCLQMALDEPKGTSGWIGRLHERWFSSFPGCTPAHSRTAYAVWVVNQSHFIKAI